MRGGGVQSVGQVLVEGQHDVDVGEDDWKRAREGRIGVVEEDA